MRQALKISLLSAMANAFRQLRLDLRELPAHIHARDPASRGIAEALLYPGLRALLLHRVAHGLWAAGWWFSARLLSEVARSLSGIEIHPGARIGRRLFIDHGMGVVVGETAVLGDDVTLYQGVTLGGTSLAPGKRHPTLLDGTVVGVGASVLGNIDVGPRASIGAGAVLLKSIGEGVSVGGIPATPLHRPVPQEAAELMHGKVYDHIYETIGNTPIVRLKRLAAGLPAQVALKLEFFNPMSSVKDRMALAMIEDAEARGILKPGMRIIEPTSGNTGIGLAFVAAAKGYPITIVMPETMSMERRVILRMFGCDLVLTPAANGMPGALAVATKLQAETPHSFMPQQFKNEANPRVHFRTTAEEIWNDTAGKVDFVVAGVGTGGTITGLAENLRNKKPGIKMIAVEPSESPVLSGGKPGPHKIQGIGAGFVPEILKMELVDEVIEVSSEESFEMSRRIILQEGIPVGISAGAVVAAALKLAARRDNAGKLVVAVVASSLERYLSTLLTEHVRDEVANLPVTPVP